MLVDQDHLDQVGHQAYQDMMVPQDLLDQLDLLELKDHQGKKEIKVLKVPGDYQELKE